MEAAQDIDGHQDHGIGFDLVRSCQGLQAQTAFKMHSCCKHIQRVDLIL